MCTIAHTPRLPEHCIEYVKVFLWPQEKPFGSECHLDGDDPAHIKWILTKSLQRAKEFGIEGVNYRMTQGVVKRIIPAVASTNAVIAAVCCLEVLKLASSCCIPLNNYMVFNDVDGIYTYAYEAEKKEDCIACSKIPQKLSFKSTDKLHQLYEYLQVNVHRYSFNSRPFIHIISSSFIFRKTLHSKCARLVSQQLSMAKIKLST